MILLYLFAAIGIVATALVCSVFFAFFLFCFQDKRSYRKKLKHLQRSYRAQHQEFQ